MTNISTKTNAVENAWSDLPNAKYIDAVIASLKANPDEWDKAWEKAGGWTDSLDAAWDAAWDAARNAAWDAARNAAWDAAWGTILALIAYDDCAHLLATNPNHVKMMAGIGNEVANLMYPASLVFSEIKNDCLV